jgi:hypothetical protein
LSIEVDDIETALARVKNAGQFYDRNFKYTWYEWFWIIRYAEAHTAKRSAKMLSVLDGTKGEREKISPKHIKNKKNIVIGFWQDYFYYVPYFFKFLKSMHLLIEKDPELKAEYSRILEDNNYENEATIEKMLEGHTKVLQHKLLDDNTTYSVNDRDDYYLGANNDDFKAVKIGQERIRIHHSNKNFKKEMLEFKNGSRKEKPKKKISCTFNPFLLPITPRVLLNLEFLNYIATEPSDLIGSDS